MERLGLLPGSEVYNFYSFTIVCCHSDIAYFCDDLVQLRVDQ